MSDFFSTLRRKLERRPGRSFDREFWQKFDAEFAPRFNWWRGLVPAGAALAVALAVTITFTRPAPGPVFAPEMVENADALKDKDMAFLLTPAAGDVKTAALLELSDEEWSALLRGDNG